MPEGACQRAGKPGGATRSGQGRDGFAQLLQREFTAGLEPAEDARVQVVDGGVQAAREPLTQFGVVHGVIPLLRR